MANRRVDDVPANPGSGKLGLTSSSAQDEKTTEPGDDIFDVPTVVTTVPNLSKRPSSPRTLTPEPRSDAHDAGSKSNANGKAARSDADRHGSTSEAQTKSFRLESSKPRSDATRKDTKRDAGARPGAGGSERPRGAQGPARETKDSSRASGKLDASSKLEASSKLDGGGRVEEASGKLDGGGTVEASGKLEASGTVEASGKLDANDKSEAAGAKQKRVLSKAAGNRLPSPSQPPRSVPVVAPPIAGVSVRNQAVTEVEETTEISNPPPPPIATTPSPSVVVTAVPARKVERRSDADATQVVTPLPAPVRPSRSSSPRVIVDPSLGPSRTASEVPSPGQPRKDRGKRIGVGVGVVGAAVLVAGILVFAIGFSTSDMSPAPASREPAAATSEDPRTPPAVATPKAVAPSTATPPAAPPPPTEIAPPSAPPAPPPSEEIDMSTETAETARPETTYTPRPPRLRSKTQSLARGSSAGAAHEPARPAAPPAPPVKPAKPLAYDPDSLFLKKP